MVNQGSGVDYALDRNFPKDTPILPPDRVRKVVATGYFVSGGYKYPCDIIESEDAGAITMNETNQHLSTGPRIFSEGAQVKAIQQTHNGKGICDHQSQLPSNQRYHSKFRWHSGVERRQFRCAGRGDTGDHRAERGWQNIPPELLQ